MQLLSLIETFGPQKKEKFLEMIEEESPTWARALREKMLTFERIFGWPEQVIVDVFKQLQPKTLAFALHGIKPEQKDKILAYFSHAEKRRLDDILSESKPKADEIASTLVKVVETCRKMLKERVLHADKFDSTLIVPEDFESKLEELASHETFQAMSSTPKAEAHAPVTKPPTAAEQVAKMKAEVNVDGTPVDAVRAGLDVIQLQKKVAELLKENKLLKDENHALRQKLDSIKRSVA